MRLSPTEELRVFLAWLLNCSDEKFEEEMKYDSFGIEEMGTGPSFDIKSLLQPREEEEFTSEYEKDSEEEDESSSGYLEDSEYEDTNDDYM